MSVDVSPTKYEDVSKQRLDRIYATFKRELDRDSVLKWSEFRRFQILFDKNNRERLLNGELDQDELARIDSLSQEFYRLVNNQRKVLIIDDITHDIMFTLPPMFYKLDIIKGKESLQLIDALDTSMRRKDDAPGSPAKFRERQLMMALGNVLMSSQSAEKIMTAVNEFDRLTAEIEETPPMLDVHVAALPKKDEPDIDDVLSFD